MSKKRKKLRKALKALGAGLAIAGLGRAFMNRNRTGTEFPRPKAGTIDQMAADNMPKNIDKVIQDVRTPTTIQDSMPRVGMRMGDIRPKNPLSKRVMDDGRVFTIKGAKEGKAPVMGNEKSIRPGINRPFNPKSIIIKDGVRVPNPAKMEADRLNMMRAIRSTPRTTFDAPDFSDMDPLMISAKSGGMIVKGEKKAVRVKKKKK